MKKLIVGSGVAAGVVVLGVFAGYWHFAELLPERQVFAERPAAPPAPTPSAPASADAPPAPGTDTAAVEASQEAAAPPVPPAPEATETAPTSPEPPSFELLRVEPDGSTVVAGRAAPGAEVELLSGGEVVGRERASASGDFAMALAEPLPVGEHALSLRAEDEAGGGTPSVEAAIVSVPEPGRENELLVALGTPNEPTRILQQPAAPAAPEAPAPAETAASEPQAAAAETAARAADALEDTLGEALSIAAVEIERDRIYVAGTTRPGGRVRVYLDDQFIAEGQGTGGDFIAEGRADVSVGSHRVRADEIGPDGSVVARVEVPFDRPEGESMAALAPGRGGAEEPAPGAPATEESAGPAEVPGEVVAAAPTPEPQPAPEMPRRAEPQPDATPPSAALEAPPVDEAVAPAAPAPVEAPEVGTASASASAPQAVSPSPPDEQTGPAQATRTQAALQPVEGRVIIRRGDTLWRISRETYGLGRRYTVIYLANGDQIRDPDLIYPGQIFRLPDEANGERRSELR